MPSVPEHAYFILEDSKWPVTAIADGPYVIDHIISEIERRVSRGDEYGMAHLHIFKCKVTDIVEVELIPSQVIKAEIRDKG